MDLELLRVWLENSIMKWIGLTGPMGSGKSTVAELLRRRGYSVLDADRIVHQLLEPGGEAESEIVKTFGEDVLGADRHLDKKSLGRAVFNDKTQLEKLERILHPLVRTVVAREKRALIQQGKSVAFYDVPLLFEKKMEADFDKIIVVTAPEDIRRRRLASRSQMTDIEFEDRSKHHISPQEKEARASAVVRNLGNLDDLDNEISKALRLVGL